MFVTASLEVNETQQQHPTNVYHDIGLTRNKIVTAQFECYQKIMKDDTPSSLGSIFCSIVPNFTEPQQVRVDSFNMSGHKSS